MKRIVVLFTLINVVTLLSFAQTNQDKIKDAAKTAKTVSKENANKLPPDTVRWRKGGDVGLNFTQTHLSNWVAGGENALSFSSSSNLFANYKKNKLIWENYAFMTYGVIKAGERKAVKNSDQINMGSRVGYQMAKKWYYTAALLGRSQFATGYQYTATDTIRSSTFLAPAYLFLSLGLDYKPSGRLSVSLSPAMGKATFVCSNDSVILALANKGKKSNYEFGGGIVFNLNGSYFSKRVTYTSQLELFSNYFDKPQNIDVAWDFQFRVALSKFVASTVRINMLYYDSQKVVTKNSAGKIETHGAKLQVKEYFEIGLLYTF